MTELCACWRAAGSENDKIRGVGVGVWCQVAGGGQRERQDQGCGGWRVVSRDSADRHNRAIWDVSARFLSRKFFCFLRRILNLKAFDASHLTINDKILLCLLTNFHPSPPATFCHLHRIL